MTRAATLSAGTDDVDAGRPTSVDLFLRDARTIAFAAADHGEYPLCERLKLMAKDRLPAVDSAEYERVMRQVARIAGV